jgi:hypothetical protein
LPVLIIATDSNMEVSVLSNDFSRITRLFPIGEPELSDSTPVIIKEEPTGAISGCTDTEIAVCCFSAETVLQHNRIIKKKPRQSGSKKHIIPIFFIISPKCPL